MRAIYPKINEYLEGLKSLEEYIKKSKGLEIQYFHKAKELTDFGMEAPIREVKNRCPYIKEITIHPPLVNYDIEMLIIKDKNMLMNQIRTCIQIADKLHIKINIIYHTHFKYQQHEMTTMPILKEMAELLKGSNVHMLLENLYMLEETKNCCVFALCEKLQSPNIAVCLDICHLYCQAHIYKMTIQQYMSSYLDKKLCEQYLYQVHFSYTDKEDGYIEKKTHGIGHLSKEMLELDMNLLEKYAIVNAIFVPEVSEQDYTNRPDQVKEIVMLEEYLEK